MQAAITRGHGVFHPGIGSITMLRSSAALRGHEARRGGSSTLLLMGQRHVQGVRRLRRWLLANASSWISCAAMSLEQGRMRSMRQRRRRQRRSCRHRCGFEVLLRSRCPCDVTPFSRTNKPPVGPYNSGAGVCVCCAGHTLCDQLTRRDLVDCEPQNRGRQITPPMHCAPVMKMPELVAGCGHCLSCTPQPLLGA
jgi:hypothetical protein